MTDRLKNAQRLTRSAAAIAVLVPMLVALFAGSCGRPRTDDSLVLREDLYGFFLGQEKDTVFKRARGVATVTRAPEPPLGYRGELWDFSAPLEPHRDVSRVRCAFFDGRLLEVIVYFRDTSLQNLDRLRNQLEGQFGTSAVAETGVKEMAQKTYRMPGPGMSITLRRITKKEGIELYIQYLHDELHQELIERTEAAEKK